MKLGPVTNLDKKTKTTSKKLEDDSMSATCDVIVIFPAVKINSCKIHSFLETAKTNSQSFVFFGTTKISSFVNS